MQLFISYASEDEIFARRLHSAIKGWGFNPWLDVINSHAVRGQETEIHEAMRESSVVIAILTPESLASETVLNQWGYALSTGKRLFLLWLRDIDEQTMPPRYLRMPRIDMRHDEASGMADLEMALRTETKMVLASRGGMQDDISPDKYAGSATQRQMNNRQRMLEKVKVFWIDGVLEQSIHGVALIELGIKQDSESVDNPWETVLRHEAYGDYNLPTSASIADIYQELGNEILILGDPGSGKTTTLLKMASDMIERAEEDEKQPIPVVFNLSSWADERKSLGAWLIDELNTKYQVPRPIAKEWVDNDELLLLLDGLDEVDKRYRDMCVLAINEFRAEKKFIPLVVCSRTLDYEALSNRLRLNGAIIIQPLNDEQILRYLNSLGNQMDGVRQAMQNDPGLRNLAGSPLMLSIMTLAFYGMSYDDLPALDSLEAQREQLFETYTRRMFERRPQGQYSQDKVLHYLRWLAGRMVERKQSVFYLENLQGDWIAGDWSRAFYRITGRLSFGVIGGFFVGTVITLALMTLLWITGAMRDVPSMKDLALISAGIISVTTGIGALIFAIAGVIAMALDFMPGEIRPFRKLGLRLVLMTLVGAFVGLLSMLIMVFGIHFADIIACTYCDNGTILTYAWHDGSSLSEWEAILFNLNLFSLIGLSLGAAGGYAAALVGFAKNSLKPQAQNLEEYSEALSTSKIKVRQHLSMSKLLQRSSMIISLAGIAGIIGATLLFALLSTYDNWYYSGIQFGFAFASILSPILTAIFLIIMTLAGRRFKLINPYVTVAGGIPFYIVMIITSWELGNLLFHSKYIYTIDNGWFWTWSILLVYLAALGGGLVGRITDDIVSAEALRWSWSWRWTSIGLIAIVVIGGLLLVENWNNWQRLNNYGIYGNSSIDSTNERIADYDASIRSNLIELEQLERAFEREIEPYNIRGLETRIHNYFIADYNSNYTYPGYLGETDGNYASLSACRSNYSNKYRDYAPQDYWNTRLSEITGSLEQDGIDNDARRVLLESYSRVAHCRAGTESLQISRRRDYHTNTEDGILENAWIKLQIAMVFGFSIIVAGGVVGGLRKTELVDIRTTPNSGIRRTFASALIVLFAFALVGLFVGALVGGLLASFNYYDIGWDERFHEQIVAVSSVVGISIGLGFGLLFGGIDAVLKHGILRLFLMRGGNIPLNYARMLDSAAELILLRKVGGGYIFIHRYLLEHFAEQELSKRKRRKSKD